MIAHNVALSPAGQYEPGATAGDWTSRRIRNLRLKSRAVSSPFRIKEKLEKLIALWYIRDGLQVKVLSMGV